MLSHQKHKCLLKSDTMWRPKTLSLDLQSCLFCVKRAGSYFCPNSGDLGQEHAGSSTAWAGREEEEARSGSVWWGLDSLQGAIKQCTVSKRLSELQPCAGKYPSGKDGGKEGRSFLSSGESETGGKRAELQEKSRWSARVSWGYICQELGIYQEPRTQVKPPSVQRQC